jgi:predicted DNA-binding transcriptional regulator AlpA
MATGEIDRLLNEREAAALLGLSPHTLNRWRVLRTGPSFTRVGRLVRYRESAIRSYIASRDVPTADQPVRKGGAR